MFTIFIKYIGTMIKVINSKKDKEQYIDLIRYCFYIHESESNFLKQLNKDSYAFGYFQDKNLKAAMISHSFTYNLWGQTIAGNGIGAVATYPELRNSGLISKLFELELKKQYKNNQLVSTLYPFKFSFYKKFGYGSLGHYKIINIDPKQINIKKINHGYFKQYNTNLANKVYFLFNTWACNYDFGIVRDKNENNSIFETYKSKSIHNYVYFDNKGSVTGFIKYEIKEKTKFSKIIYIKYISWKDKEAFEDLLAFLYFHRDQCIEVEWTLPQNIPVELYFNEPRIEQKYVFSWMARPVNLLKLIELKIKNINVNRPFYFSVKDDYIEENTGTYYIDRSEVTKKEYTWENDLFLSDLSSMLFGAYTAKELSIDMDCEFFNTKNDNIFISEFF